MILNRLQIIFLIVFFFGFAKLTLSQQSKNSNVTITRVSKISLKKLKYEISLNEGEWIFYCPKNLVVDYINYQLDTFLLKISDGENVEFNRRWFDKYSVMKKLILDKDIYEILDVTKIDSLKSKDIFEKSEIIESNTELSFKFNFRDILCQLLSKGDLSINKNGIFLDSIYKNKYSESSENSVYSSIRYTNKDGYKLCECPPIIWFN